MTRTPPPRPILDLSNRADREHIRHHRPGVPSKLARDTEVRAWIEARIFRHPFAELAELARAEWGRERAPGRSALNRWFRRNEERLLETPGSAVKGSPGAGAGSPEEAGMQRARGSEQRARCLWCGSTFAVRATGGRGQRFCAPACRRTLDTAARRFVVREIAAGRLSVAELLRYAGSAEAAEQESGE